MANANCPSCGSPITHVRTREGEHIPIDNREDSSGEGRYRIIEIGPPHIVEPVPANSMLPAFPDHRLECPGHGNSQR